MSNPDAWVSEQNNPSLARQEGINLADVLAQQEGVSLADALARARSDDHFVVRDLEGTSFTEVRELLRQLAAAFQAKEATPTEGPPGARTPISEIELAGGGGFVRRYSSGNIYYHRRTGAKWVYGAILSKYLELGGPAGRLGFPVTDELPAANGGRYNDFQKGSIYFSASTGACEMHGKVRDHWRALGAESSYLGFPVLDQTTRMARFERGTVQIQDNEFVFDVSDARQIKTGVIHVDGAAANGWAELMVSSTGGWKFKGSMRSTGALGYDVLMVMSFDLREFGGQVIGFHEKGDVEGTLVLGGNRAHTWDHFGMDERVKENWDLIRKTRVTSVLRVDFGPGDVLAIVGSTLAVPLIVLAAIAGGQVADANVKACGYIGHDYYDRDAGNITTERGVVFVSKGEPCPPGTFEQL
jgi:hypothetical protein